MSLLLPSPGYQATMFVGGAVQVNVLATVLHAANSEVLFEASVAVAVTTCPPVVTVPSVVLNEALPEAFVVIEAEPRKTWPSPLPDVSQAGFAKNSTENVALAVEFNVPCTFVVPPVLTTCVNTGKFCRLFDPVSPSPVSL